MRNGCRWLIALTWFVAVAPALAAEGGEGEGGNAAITIIGSPSILPEGTRCVIELNAEEDDREIEEKTYEGTIGRATDEEIVLIVRSERLSITRKSPASSIPVLNRLTRNVGIRMSPPGEERSVSIPAGRIRSVRCLGNPGT